MDWRWTEGNGAILWNMSWLVDTNGHCAHETRERGGGGFCNDMVGSLVSCLFWPGVQHILTDLLYAPLFMSSANFHLNILIYSVSPCHSSNNVAVACYSWCQRSYRRHYASCLSFCLSVHLSHMAYGLVTQKKQKKTYKNQNWHIRSPLSRAWVSWVLIFIWNGSGHQMSKTTENWRHVYLQAANQAQAGRVPTAN